MDAFIWKRNEQDRQIIADEQSSQAGLNCGRLVHADIKRGRPENDYMVTVCIASKNGSAVGDINYSHHFTLTFRKNSASVITKRLKIHLNKPFLPTGRKIPIALLKDKMTQKKRTDQITAISALPADAPAEDTVKTLYM